MRGHVQQAMLRTQAIFLWVLATISLLIPILLAISAFFFHRPSEQIHLVLDDLLPTLSPKPRERFIFTALVVVMPIYALFLIFIKKKFISKSYSMASSFTLPVITTTLLFIPLFNADFLNGFLAIPLIHTHSTFKLLFFILFAILWCRYVTFSNHRNLLFLPKKSFIILSWLILISALILTIAPWRIVSIKAITHEATWTVHADAALYALSQVIAGKTLLYDLPSQYGLFPELIAPLFKIFKASIFNITLFFATLQFLSLFCLFFVLSKLVRQPTWFILGGLSLLIFSFHTILHFFGSVDSYYQYWPNRFFWPAISVLLFYFFLCKKNLYRSSCLSLAGAIGTIWVIDTGVFITLAFAAYLFFKYLALRIHPQLNLQKSNGETMHYLLAFALHLVITVLVIALFLLLLRLKAHHPLNLFWLFEYPFIFYGLGFFMIPLPHEIHPWMTILGVYLLGIIATFIGWYNQADRVRLEMIFYLSLIGVGMFIYYEGRSHICNLEKACWPAIMIVVILADDILYRLNRRALLKAQIIFPIAILSFLLVCVSQFIIYIPWLVREGKNAFLIRNKVADPIVQSELKLIKSHAQRGEECLILAKNQGIYYIESGLASPIRGPGLVETFLKEDFHSLFSTLLSGNINCLFIGVGDSSTLGNLTLTDRYNLVDINPEHTMIFLQPKKNTAIKAN